VVLSSSGLFDKVDIFGIGFVDFFSRVTYSSDVQVVSTQSETEDEKLIIGPAYFQINS
jgi:hypothetical protein